MKPEQIEEARKRLDLMAPQASALVICSMSPKGEVLVHVGSSAIDLVFMVKSLDLICDQMLTNRPLPEKKPE